MGWDVSGLDDDALHATWIESVGSEITKMNYSTSPPPDFYLNEIHQRSLGKQTTTMRRLTWAIFVLTVANVGAVILAAVN